MHQWRHPHEYALLLCERYARARLWDIVIDANAKGYKVTVISDPDLWPTVDANEPRYLVFIAPDDEAFLSTANVVALNVNQSPIHPEWLDAIEDLYANR